MYRARVVSGLAVLVVCLDLASVAGAEFVAYNDCNFNGDTTSPNVTYYTVNNPRSLPTSGLLVDNSTGTNTGVTVTMEASGNWTYILWDGGAGISNTSSDAYAIFENVPGLDVAGMLQYDSSAGWYEEIVFTGLNPNLSYEFATTANRGGSSSYDDRWTKWTIMEADTYTYASSAASGGPLEKIGEDCVQFRTGSNGDDGYVAKWTDITAADGSFTIRVEAAGDPYHAYKGYGPSVFMLEEIIPEPATMGLLGLGVVGLVLRRRRK